MHRAVCCVFAASPWGLETSMCAVYPLSHKILCTNQSAAARLAHWLQKHVVRDGTWYCNMLIPPLFPRGFSRPGVLISIFCKPGLLCSTFLNSLLFPSPLGAACICVWLGGCTQHPTHPTQWHSVHPT